MEHIIVHGGRAFEGCTRLNKAYLGEVKKRRNQGDLERNQHGKIKANGTKRSLQLPFLLSNMEDISPQFGPIPVSSDATESSVAVLGGFLTDQYELGGTGLHWGNDHFLPWQSIQKWEMPTKKCVHSLLDGSQDGRLLRVLQTVLADLDMEGDLILPGGNGFSNRIVKLGLFLYWLEGRKHR